LLIHLGFGLFLPPAMQPTVCPPKNFDSVAKFDINRYTSAPW
jgi:hypothetical protein